MSRSRLPRTSLLAPLLVGWLVGCAPSQPAEIRIAWTEVDELNESLPEGIRVYAGNDPSIPLKAWYVSVDEPAPEITTRVALATGETGREPASSIARRTDARVVVNGGYFRMDLEPTTHVGLLMIGGLIVEPALDSVIRDEVRYFTARGAVGLTSDGGVDVSWVSSLEGRLYEWDMPPQNAPGVPGAPIRIDTLSEWRVRDALAAGPVLVHDGRVRVTVDAEVFFGSSIPDVHPRTAVGYTREGSLVMMVVDGRQRDSRGADLVELATLMRDLGCVEALNLDGGGSSTLIVDGVLVNRPVGADSERPIMSALAVYAE